MQKQELLPLPSREAMLEGKYWFRDKDLVKPINWGYIRSLPEKVKLALELYLEGKVSIGRATEISGLSFREFNDIRGKAKIPIRGPED
jgi:predicted HTH domain antitoxin